MSAQSTVQEKYNTPLRQAQRDLTRNRIKTAARNFFYEHHYDGTTMDEIALAAGLRRSTLYLHYKDKAEILAEVIADYTPKAKANLATLPGPTPTLEQVQQFIRRVVRFVDKERVPLSIILELRRAKVHAAALETLTSELLSGLGENNRLFREAAKSDADPMLRARGLLLLQQLTYSCQVYLDTKGDKRAKAMLEVTAQDFTAFLAKD